MRQYLILMRPLWSEMLGTLSQGFAAGGRKKKKKKMTLEIKRRPSPKLTTGLLFGFIYTMLAFYSVMYGISITKQLALFGQEDGFIQMVAVGAPLLVLLFGILQAIPTLYHESSLEALLVLPVKPSIIIAGKMTQAYIPVVIFPVALFFPALIAHAVVTARPWAFYIQALPFMLLVTLAPFTLVVILIMLLMRYTKFARDKDRFQMVTSIITILFAVSFSIFINLQSSGGQLPGSSLFSPGGEAPLIQGPLRFLPSSWFSAAMLVRAGSWHTLLYGLIALAINVAALAALLLLAGRLYLPGVMGMKAGGKPAKVLSAPEQAKALKPRSPYRAILARDSKLLIRTPAFFSQTVLISLLLPVLLAVILVITFINLEKDNQIGFSLIGFLRLWAGSGMWKDSLWVLVMIASGAAALLSGTNMMSASAISRQGTLFAYSKLMPVPVGTQLLAWLTPGIASLTGVWLLIALASTLYLRASFLFGLVIFLTAWINAYLIQMVGFYVDMLSPRLDWTNEIHPVKNTRATTVSGLGLFIYIGLIVAFGFLVRRLSGGHSLITALAMFSLSLALAVLTTWLVKRRADQLFLSLDL